MHGGLFTSNPMTINVLEKATMRKINVTTINKKIDKIKVVAYDIFDSSEWIESYRNGIVNTNYFVSHDNLQNKISRVYPLGEFSMDVNLPEGHEWLAFTFRHQRPLLDSVEDLDNYLSYSNDVIREAYSRMDMANQPWASHTKIEIDYLLNNYINSCDAVIDVGCGTGRHTIKLNRRSVQAFGIDFSERRIQYAKQQLSSEVFKCIDIRHFHTHKKYDVALALYDVVGSYPDEVDNYKILKSVYNCLKPNGRIILSVMNMDLTCKICSDKVDSIHENIDKLLALEGSATMQTTGNIFNGDAMLIDTSDGTVYRKEQFTSSDSLPCEYIIRDRRYTAHGISLLLKKAGFVIDHFHYFNAKDISKPLRYDDLKAKELFIVARKMNIFKSTVMSFAKMPQAWI